LTKLLTSKINILICNVILNERKPRTGFSTNVFHCVIPAYKTIILPVVLYGRETWSLTLRDEHRLRVFENRVLRRIFGPKRDEVTGEWRKLHNEELHDF
jgi:hypothetical protein